MGDYKVESGVPIPARWTCKMKYPFNVMEVGDSFGFDSVDEHRIDVAARHYGRAHHMTFSVRNYGNGMARVWRTK